MQKISLNTDTKEILYVKYKYIPKIRGNTKQSTAVIIKKDSNILFDKSDAFDLIPTIFFVIFHMFLSLFL